MGKVVTYGILVTLGALWLWCWALMRILLRHERWIQDLRRTSSVEQRCEFCQDKECPARNSGVTYPCEYFMKEEHYGKSNEHPDP